MCSSGSFVDDATFQVGSDGVCHAPTGGVSITAGGATIAGGVQAASTTLSSGDCVQLSGVTSITSASTTATTLDVYASASSFAGTVLRGSLATTTGNALQLLQGTTSALQVCAGGTVAVGHQRTMVVLLQAAGNGLVVSPSLMSTNGGVTVQSGALVVSTGGITVSTGSLVASSGALSISSASTLSSGLGTVDVTTASEVVRGRVSPGVTTANLMVVTDGTDPVFRVTSAGVVSLQKLSVSSGGLLVATGGLAVNTNGVTVATGNLAVSSGSLSVSTGVSTGTTLDVFSSAVGFTQSVATMRVPPGETGGSLITVSEGGVAKFQVTCSLPHMRRDTLNVHTLPVSGKV